MTTHQSQIFSKLLDANWEASLEKDMLKKIVKLKLVNEYENQLRESMGAEAYNKFIENGKKMFAPLKK